MKTKFRADDVVVNMPLFHDGQGGSIPTSAHQLEIFAVSRDTFMPLNEAWHSRLPECKNAFEGIFYGALFDDRYFAVAWWSKPVARMLNGRGWLELRRLAIGPDAPKNTASRMLRIMRLMISKNRPEVSRLISYQDAEVHTGTIYRASGWKQTTRKVLDSKGWKTRESNRQNQSTADKLRWEYVIRPDVERVLPDEKRSHESVTMDLFVGDEE